MGLVAGTIVGGRYHIEEELGRGGFARVYRATHTDLGRQAALKVIELPQQPGAVDAFISRFLREARIAANLSHPNVVTVYDYGVVESTGQPFLAMELLEGWDLEMVLAHQGPMTPPRALELMGGVLDALATAQQKGIVHKDLKPSNLFLVGQGTRRERVVLIDFGIARIWDDEDSRITQTGGFTGTPAYFAPEYVQHQIVTPAIDVYQSGLILIEMMTGTPAVVAGNSMAYLLKHCSGQVDVPEVLAAGPLGPVLRKAICVDHTARYPDCATFRDALAQIDPASVVAPPRSNGGPAVRGDTLENPPSTDEFHDALSATLPPEDLVTSPETPGALQGASDELPNHTRAPAIAVALVALLLLGGVAILLARPGTAVPDPAPIVEPAPEPVVPVVVPEPVPPARQDATVSTIPAGALLKIDGVAIGHTPVTVAGAFLDGEHQLELVLDGHESHKSSHRFESGEMMEIALVAIEKPEPKPKRQKRARKKPRKTPRKKPSTKTDSESKPKPAPRPALDISN